MPYGILKCDTVTFTDAGVDKSVSISGLVQNPTFSGNVTVTGTISGVTVTGTTASFTSGNFINISGDTHTITSGVFAAGSATNPSISFTSDPNTGIYSPGADQVAISTNGTKRFEVDANGNINIDSNTFYVDAVNNRVGVGTTSPSSALNVIGNELRFSNSTNASYYGTIAHDAGSTGNNIYNVQDSGGHVFQLNGTERARIDSSGRLLVGTSTARSNVYVGSTASTPLTQVNTATNTYDNGLALINYTANGYATWLTIGSSGSNTLGTNTATPGGYQIGGINFVGNDGTNFRSAAFIAAENDQAGAWASGDCPGRLVFSVTKDGQASPTEAMRISNDGSIYFGSTSTTAPSMYFGPDSAGGRFIKNTNSTNSRTAFTFQINGTDVGSITTSGSSTAYNTSSDYRLKENVVAVTDGIARLQQLKPSRFNFVADPDHTVDGFIAHEVQEVVPEAIHGFKDEVDADGKPVYQGIDQSKLVPLLTAALQEAVAKIESLEARLTAAGI